MSADKRYATMSIALGAPGHIADEVVAAVARKAEAEKWPDKRRYTQELVRRVYVHVNAHVKKNPAWQRYGGGFEVTVDDCAQHVLIKMASSPADAAHAEVAFGDLVYKRSLDFADTLFSEYQKKRAANDPGEEDFENLQDDTKADDDPDLSEMELEERFDRESLEERDLERVYELIQDESFLTDQERIAFTYHWIGQIQIRSKDPEKLTICMLMGRSDKSVRLYIDGAMAKIKERLQ